jgi:hypothetical protein
MLRWLVGMAIALSLLCSPALGYQLTSWVFSGGAHTASSASYQMTATLGQPSPIGISTGGASYDLYHGFWYTLYGYGPNTPSLFIDRLSASQCRLWWYTVAGATSYNLYRDTAAFFAAGSPWQSVSAPDTDYVFGAGVGNPNTNYYFLCRSLGAWGESGDSPRVGEYDFGTTTFAGQKDVSEGELQD